MSYPFIFGGRKNCSSEVLTIALTTSFIDNTFPVDTEGVLVFATVSLALSEFPRSFAVMKIFLHIGGQILVSV